MYCELHCHSAFSLLDGASTPEALVARARELGYPALALTDHDELGGVVRFAGAAEEAGIGGIIGADLTVAIEAGKRSIEPRVDTAGGSRVHRDPAGSDPDSSRVPSSLVLLAETREGYGNISTLITRGRMDASRGSPSVTLDDVARHARGIFALTGCPRGWVPSLVRAGRHDEACEAAATLLDIFEGRLAIECWDHGLEEERTTSRGLIEIARVLDIPWVVTNDVHYATPTGRRVHDVLSALRHERTLDEMGTRLRPSGEWYLKSAEQIARRWQHAPEGVRATLAVAERCAFRLGELRPTLPAFPLPPGISADEYLARLVERGAHERWGGVEARTEAHENQIAHELGLIRRLGLAGFFLIVWDIVRFARREGILCQGRGSAANSAVCYCLGITAVDPIRLGLLFERFLSEDRQEAPDIDIDFAHRDREHVLQYVYERYGREHAAMVCEQITYRGRSAVRDAARVLGFSVEQADALSLLSDRFSARATAERLAAATSPEAGAEEADSSGSAPRGGESAGRGGAVAGGRSAAGEMADALGSQMVRGTEATNRAREEKLAARKITHREKGGPGAPGEMPPLPSPMAASLASQISGGGTSAPRGQRRREMDAARKPPESERRLTSADRPQPNAAYEPYGSPSAHEAAGLAPGWLDPHASDDHTERRNPTTRLTSSGSENLLAQAGLDPADPRVRALATIVGGLHDIPRHRSIHVGGFVLTEQPLSTVVPIEPASMPGRTVIQWEKDDLDPIGLVKIDLLGLGMLTVLQECLKYIRASRGVTIDLAQLDMTDQAVYDDLCAADTIGIFQVESRAQMNTLPRLKPRCFYDLVVEVALIRPGPIQGEMVHPYLRRRAGEEEITYPHPTLEPILRRTLGVPLFQEQGMQVAIAAAGFTPGDADRLRRAMGHKRSRERMAAICERLIEGMQRNGIPEETAHRIYNQINAFADYGFPESHAASFALLVYASAYLKHYYAPEFTAAMLNAQPMGFYAPGTLIEDARRHGVEVRGVDAMKSGWECSLEQKRRSGQLSVVSDQLVSEETPQPLSPSHPRSSVSIRGPGSALSVSGPSSVSIRGPGSAGAPAPAPAVRLGLRMVRGLGPAARERLEAALRDGPFRSVADVVSRVKLGRAPLVALAESGAFDSMYAGLPERERRRAALWNVLESLRGEAGPLAPTPEPDRQAPLPAMSPVELTEADYRMTGLSLAGHPMRHLRTLLEPNGVKTARQITDCRDGERVAVAGLVICRQRPGTARGFVFLTLEDETGLVNVVVTPKRFERQALMISTSPLLLIRGTLQVEQKVFNIRGEHFRALKARAGEDWAPGHDFH